MKNKDSLPGRPARTTSQASFIKRTLIALVLALTTADIALQAASPPPATLLYTDTAGASIHGGVATIGTTGYTYLSILSTPSTRARVIKLSNVGTVVFSN